MSEICCKCGAKCCTYFCFEIDKPTDFDEFEDVRWYLCHDGVAVHIDEGSWFISIENRCKMLGADNRCTDYDNRPMICRKYAMDNCDMTGGDYEYTEHFRTPQELDAYARRTLGEKAYDKARAAAMKKLETTRKSEKNGETAKQKTNKRPG